MGGKINLAAFLIGAAFLIAFADLSYGGVGIKENGEGGGSTAPHYAGRDCLSCHSSGEHQLLLAGTVFSAYNSATPCAGASLQLLDTATTAVVYDTKNYYSEDSNGIGNFYIKRASFSAGPYFVRIVSADGITLAQSGAPHSFSGKTGTTDLNNRYSCNACHKTPPANGAAGPIYAQQNTVKCSDKTAYTPYDGPGLYNTYCASCHNAGINGAQSVAGTGRGDDINILKNAIQTNKSRAGVTTNMNVLSFLSNAQLQAIVNYTFPLSETMPVPDGQLSRSFNPAETPVITSGFASSTPVGTGNLAGGLLNWQVGLPAFSGPVDVYAAVQSGAYVLFLDSNNQFTKVLCRMPRGLPRG